MSDEQILPFDKFHWPVIHESTDMYFFQRSVDRTVSTFGKATDTNDWHFTNLFPCNKCM